jgi:N-methylhydantoinase B
MKSTSHDLAFDAVTVGVVWSRLVSIVEEATAVQYRTAFSTIVQEANDFACSIMSPDGTTLANSQSGLPSFVHTQSVTLRRLLETHDAGTFTPGDVFITNDPWIATGHSMDITVLRPIFRDGGVVAFAGSVAHAPDLGGLAHWNRSTDVFAEGLLIPLTRVLEGGRENTTLLSLLRANSRMPDLTIGDLEAQLAATRLIDERLVALLDEHALPDLSDVAEEIYARCERITRDAIAEIPDGEYVGELISDWPSIEAPADADADQSVLIRATIRIEGSDLALSFEGSSPQVPGSFNSVEPFTAGYALYALRLALAPLVPNNGGFYRPMSVFCPSGTVVNASYPSATISRHVLGHQVVDAVYGALAKAVPHAVLAQSGSAPCWDLILTGRDRRGRPFHRVIILNGGTGASSQADGMTGGFPANLTNTPIEVMEALMPVVWECKAIRRGSGGAGRQRGGDGQRLTVRALSDLEYSILGGRTQHVAAGICGGGPGSPGGAHAAGCIPVPTDGILRAGETLTLETPGGGGFGDPGVEGDR